MLIKIDRQEAIKNFPILPLRHYDKEKEEEIFNQPKVFANYVLSPPSKSYKGHQKLHGTQISSLTKNLGYDQLIFPGDIDIAWLRRLDTSENFQKELLYLADNKISKRFNGALQVGTDELQTFIKHLSWMVRTNGVLPFVHFTDPGQNVLGDICQYGNLHIATKTKAVDKLFKDIVAKTKFTYLTDENLHQQVFKKNVIKGRTLAL